MKKGLVTVKSQKKSLGSERGVVFGFLTVYGREPLNFRRKKIAWWCHAVREVDTHGWASSNNKGKEEGVNYLY